MQIKRIIPLVSLTLLGLFPSLNLGATTPQTVVYIPNPKNQLNIRLRQSLCAQNWGQAIQVIDQMRAVAPEYTARLITYRSQLVAFRNSRARIAGWPPALYCAGGSSSSINPTTGQSNSSSPSLTIPPTSGNQPRPMPTSIPLSNRSDL